MLLMEGKCDVRKILSTGQFLSRASLVSKCYYVKCYNACHVHVTNVAEAEMMRLGERGEGISSNEI